MPTFRSFTPLVALALLPAVTAQITYVDADFNTNTTHADGSPHTPVIGNVVANDNLWQVRPFATSGTIISSNDAGTGSEDCPMLRTRITGLIPTLPYIVWGYQWSTQNDTAQWRLRMQVDTVQPAGPLPLWHTKGTTNTPMSTPLPFDAYASPVVNLALQYDAAGIETSGHFANPVMVREGNRCMYEIPLGIFHASVTGEIDVYIDDDPQSGNFNRNWYDGVGYEMAPLPTGTACGNPATQIAFTGEPLMRRPFTIGLSGATPNTLALLTFGFTSSTWNNLPLPVALGQFGFPGCFLNANSQFNLFMISDGSGAASQTFNLSGVPIAPLDWQWGVLEANGAATMTAGLHTVIHR